MTIKRLNYFTGQFLEAADFQAEQDYHIDMRRRGNRALYFSAGILDGFVVTRAPGDPTKIIISPGIGIDTQGRELVITEAMTVSLPLNKHRSTVVVALSYFDKSMDSKTVEDTVIIDGVPTTTIITDATRKYEEPVVAFEYEGAVPADAIQIAKFFISPNGKLMGPIIDVDRQLANVRFPNNVIVGQGGNNGVLKTRNIDGKSSGPSPAGDDNDHLYLNCHTGKDVYLGFGGGVAKSSLYVSGNVGVGTTDPKSKLSVVGTDAKEIDGAAQSSTFRISAGSLGTAAGSGLSLASIGFHSGIDTSSNNTSLGIRAYRSAEGVNWQTAAIGLGIDVDGVAQIKGASLWLHPFPARVGICTSDPQATLHVNGDALIAGANPIRFTSKYSGFPDISTGNPPSIVPNHAEISNDTSDFKALMIVGNSSSGNGRVVLVHDRLEVKGVLHATGEIQTKSAFRMVCGDYGSFFRNDGYYTHLFLTDSGEPYGSESDLQPLSINNATGQVSLSSLNVTGNITWGNDHSDKNYVRIGNMQIAWGQDEFTSVTTEIEIPVTFPNFFSPGGAPAVTVSIDNPGYNGSTIRGSVGAYGATSTGFRVFYKKLSDYMSTESHHIHYSWIAIGSIA